MLELRVFSFTVNLIDLGAISVECKVCIQSFITICTWIDIKLHVKEIFSNYTFNCVMTLHDLFILLYILTVISTLFSIFLQFQQGLCYNPGVPDPTTHEV